MIKKKFQFLHFVVFLAIGILAKYVYTFTFTIPPFPQVSMNLVALPSILSSLLFGPLYGALVGGVVDVLGHLLHPLGPFLPQITVMAILRGLIPGLIIHRFAKLGLFQSTALAIGLSQISVAVIYGSIILAPFFELSFGELLISRTVTQLFSIPLFSIISYAVLRHEQTEKELEKSAERYRSLVDNVPEVLFQCQWNKDWAMTFISDSILDITGYPPSDFLENAVRPYKSIIHQKDLERVERTIEEQISRERPYRVTYRIHSKKGSIKWVRETGKAIKGPHNNVEYVSGAIADITELKETEDALRISEEKHRSIVQVIPDIIIHCNRDGVYLDVYASEENLLILSKDRLLGKRIIDVFPKEQGESFMEGVREALSHQSLETTEYSLLLHDKSTWFEARLLPINEEELIALIRNITRRKEAEEQAANYLKALELQREELALLYEQLDKEIDRARVVHQQLLQKEFPTIEGLSFSAFHKPASYIGGDFHKIIKKEQQLVVYLSDVTGHGLDGAMFSTFVKNTIRSYIDLNSKEGITPERILNYLDTRVRNENYPCEYAVALFLMVIDQKTKEASYSGVGFQNPPVVIKNDGSLQFLISEGLPISPNVPKECMDFQGKKKQFFKDDTLFLSTDGLYEQRAHHEFYEERLLSLLAREGSGCINRLNDRITKDFQDFLGEIEQDDDVTFLIMRIEKG